LLFLSTGAIRSRPLPEAALAAEKAGKKLLSTRAEENPTAKEAHMRDTIAAL